jgi:hypothetical protein
MTDALFSSSERASVAVSAERGVKLIRCDASPVFYLLHQMLRCIITEEWVCTFLMIVDDVAESGIEQF